MSPASPPVDTPVVDTPVAVARACVEAASDEPFEQFVAPMAGGAFRAHLARRVADLRCCFTHLRQRELDGAHLHVVFEPRGNDPADGAAARLVEPDDPARPNEQRCLRAVVTGWGMSRAPSSDVVRVPLDPRISSRSSAARVSIVYPL